MVMLYNNINHLRKIVGNDICSQVLFIHAMTGCDTTSRIYNVGRMNAFHKIVKRDTVLRLCANAFTEIIQPTKVIDNLRCQVTCLSTSLSKSLLPDHDMDRK